MSELATQQIQAPDWKAGEVPQPLQQRLDMLRRSIAGSTWLEGLSRLSLLTVAIIVGDFLLDYLFHMDFSQRAILGLLSLAGLGYAAYRWLMIPLSRHASDDALLVSVEKKLNLKHNTLINTLQLARETEGQPHYSQVMARHVVDSGLGSVKQVDFKTALNHARNSTNRWWLTLGLACLAIIFMLTIGTELGRIWFSRNILLGSEKWPTQTRLVVEGVQDGVLVVPRGEDHLLIASVDPDCAKPDVEVFVDFMSRSSGTRQKMRINDGDPLEHRTTLRSVNSEFSFRVIGGDFQTDPIQIRLVEPPGFAELKLTAIPPAYSELDPQPLPLSVENYKLLQGSQLKIEGKTEQSGVQLNWVIGEKRTSIPVSADNKFETILVGDQLQTGRYRLDLQDQDGIASNRPVEFSVEVLTDRTPRIRAASFGVSSMVMSKARIPISVAAEDEFGIAKMDIQMKVGTDEDALVKSLPIEPLSEQFGQSEITGDTEVDLKPLDVVAGSTVGLVVQGWDQQPVTNENPNLNLGVSKTMLFQVVTESEFRADLLRREMEQTKAFEKLIQQQQAVLTELKVLQAAQAEESETEESFAARKNQLANNMGRQQGQVATLLVQITDRFRGFLEEVVNNRVDEGLSDEDSGQRIGERLATQIVQPLVEIDGQTMPEVTRGLEWVSRNAGKPTELTESLDDTIPKMEQLIIEMKNVLNAMQRSQSFQELVNDLIAIKREEEGLKKQAEQKKKEADSALEEIFD